MLGKRLSIEDLERLKAQPNGAKVYIGEGLWFLEFTVGRTPKGEMYITSGKQKIYYHDLIGLDVLDIMESVVNPKNHKPEIRIVREFNTAKKKELDVKPLNGNEKYKLNKARLEFLVDIALEESNEEDFIKFSSKLKKYYSKEAI